MSTPTTRNITRAFRLATDADREHGRRWYAEASAVATSLADHGQSRIWTSNEWEDAYVRAAGVLAVLSPRTSWPLNVRYARQAYDLYAALTLDGVAGDAERDAFVAELPTTGDCARKAWAILSGADVDDTVRGPKVRTFWHQIVDPASALAVVVDRHALDVAVGRVQSDAERGKLLGKRGSYDAVATLYKRAARAINADGRYGTGWTPAEVQATTWVYWRRERAAANHG